MGLHVNPEDPDLYALGALEGEEKAAFEAHVRSCAACARAAAAAQQRIAMLGLTAQPVAVPARVKDDLMRRVHAERKAQLASARRSRPRRWLVPALVMSTLLFAALTGWLWTRNHDEAQQIATLRLQLAQAQARSLEIATASDEIGRVAGAPGTIHVALTPQPGAPAESGSVLYNPRSGTIAWFAQMPPAPRDKSYQLWLVPASGAPVSLGVFSANKAMTEFTAQVNPGTTAKAFAVTVEPKGGRPQPTGAKVLVGAVKG